MYLSYYGLAREPFQMAPDPAFFFLSPGHRRALEMIRRGVENRAGLMMITGAEGLGKTMVIRSAAQLLASEGVRSVFVLNPRLSYRELLQVIFGQLNLDCPEGEEQFELLRRLQQVLAHERHGGKSITLFIDEAQEMPVDTLENLRLLSDMEQGGNKLVQVVLAGRLPDIEKRFEAFDLRQLKQRIAYRASLVRLTPGESIEYIKHRLRCALQGTGDVPFSPSSLALIAKHCGGIPDRINIVCRGALATGSALGLNPIPPQVVGRVIADLGGRASKRWLKWALAPAALIILGAVVPYLRSTNGNAPPADAVRQAEREPDRSSSTSRTPPLPGIPPKDSVARTGAESPERARIPMRYDDIAEPSAAPGAPSESTSPSLTIAHPPKSLPPDRPEGGPKADTPLPAKSGGTTPSPSPQDKPGTPARATNPTPPRSTPPGQSSQNPSKPTPPPPSSARQPRDRQSAPPLSPAENSKKIAPSQPAASSREATAKNIPQAGPGRPDPSEIVDWYIGQRTKAE